MSRFIWSVRRIFIFFSMSGRKYIPAAGLAFCDWAMNAVVYCRDGCTRWGVQPPDVDMEEAIEELRRRIIECAKAATKAEVAEKNAMRDEIEGYLRQYLQGTVARNPKVTDADRLAIGLNVRDASPTPVGKPVGQATAAVKYRQERSLELQVAPVDPKLFDKRANYGVKIVHEVFPFGTPAPADMNLLHRSMFTRRKKEIFSFTDADRGQIAWFRLRYENSKGEPGEWGPFISAVIP